MRHLRLDGGDLTVALALAPTEAPRLVYLGPRLPADAELAALDAALDAPRRESAPDAPAPLTVLPTAGAGFMGEPALSGDRGPIAWSETEAAVADGALVVTLRDRRAQLTATLRWAVDPDTGVLTTSTHLRNDADTPFALDALAALALPLPDWAREIVAFDGDWAREARPMRFAAPPGAWRQTNRSGRTGFAGATFAVAEPGAADLAGRVLALHLAWSGGHAFGVETLAGGARQAFLRPLLARDEIVVAPGAGFATPEAHVAFSDTGFDGVSAAFHPFMRRIMPARREPRRVHFNTWEAVYFDLDAARLMALADRAADLGAERFVLDDGWFEGRRSDRAGLGDWRVDAGLFPQGLAPLIAHVQRRGMDFGLWVEPEMVNPDSALYRAHPDWCVHAPDGPRPTMRNQLWLDLSRPDVRDHLFEALHALLDAHDIAYLKWDCNRTLFPATSRGRPVAHALTEGVYALLDRLRAAHPQVEIESCASGGARIDLGVLRRTTRVWPSDTTDAVERLRIQRWTGLLLPPESLGAHVGPSPNPITGRRIYMTFRARVAMFGHMGVELDPARLNDADRACLAAHIALYKDHRALLHSGRRICWTSDDGVQCWMSVAPDGGEALALLARADVASNTTAAPVRFPGLDRRARYAVSLAEPWPARAARRLADDAWTHPRILDGAALAESGLRLPLSDPETAWLVHFRRT